MPDIWMDVDAALAEVPVNIMPLIDDTDFKTIEDAIAFDATGMDLRWNFVTTAGAYTSTAVTPTSAGNYDWAHQGDGMYSIEIPASGGASINNDTEGFGWFSGRITGVLPFRGPVIGFRAAAINNALIDGGDTLDVNVTTAADTAWNSGAIGASTIATGAIDADALSADAGTELADAILSRNVSNVEGSAGEHTLCTVVLACLEWEVSGATWTIQRTNGSTTHVTKTLTTDGAAEHVTAVE